ncbi:MAG: hypothetical protein ABH834_01495 [Candidatus Altiarchaeota archaeon]
MVNTMAGGELEQAIQEMAFNYNLNLLEGEEAMTEAEMAAILEDDMEKMERRYQMLLLRDTLSRQDMSSRSVGVDFRHIRESRKRETEPDPSTELIHEFDAAAQTCDSKRMAEIREEYAGLVEDAGGPTKVDELVLHVMDHELERCEIQVIQEPPQSRDIRGTGSR